MQYNYAVSPNEVCIMKHSSGSDRHAVRLFSITAVLFFLFILYIAFFEGADLRQIRSFPDCVEVKEYSVQEHPDRGAREYTWALGEITPGEECLNIYLVHHTARVYLDDTLVYDLAVGQGNRVCATVGSCWCCIPLFPEDSGKTVGVVVEPLFAEVSHRVPLFYLGSQYALLQNLLSQEFPELLLSVVCILLGLFISAFYLFLSLTGRRFHSDMIFLGEFSLLIGIWRITDLRTISFLFTESTTLLNYATIGALGLCVIPLLLMFARGFGGAFRKPALWLSMVASCLALVILLCQVVGIAEFRQTLILIHGMSLLTLGTIVGTALINCKRGKNALQQQTLWYVVMLATGTLLDFLRFCINGNSAGMLFTAAAFIIFVLIQFVRSVMETSAIAYMDPQTGLINKFRWDEEIQRQLSSQCPIGVMMLDLNRLKYVNDTQGHEVGDRMIFSFTNILRNTLPPNSVICRWGGDEFTVMIADTTREQMERHLANLHKAGEEYNRQGQIPAIYFAAGFALSTEHPGLSGAELLSKADEAMYQEKRAWYAEHPTTE